MSIQIDSKLPEGVHLPIYMDNHATRRWTRAYWKR